MNAVYPRLTPLTPDERCNPQMNPVYPLINADCCLAILLPLLDPACLLLTHLLRMCVAACLLTGSSWHWCLALPADDPARDVLLPAMSIAHPVAGSPVACPAAGPTYRLPCVAVPAASSVLCQSRCRPYILSALPIAHFVAGPPVAVAGPAYCQPCLLLISPPALLIAGPAHSSPAAGPAHSLLALLAADFVAGPAHSSFPTGLACCWPRRRPCP